MSKTNSIDPNVPASSESPRLGDNRIRALGAGCVETWEVDHYMGTDGGSGSGHNEDAAGEHNKVTLREQSSKPSAEANKGYLYSKVVSGKAELFYEDEDGNEVQITAAGILSSLNLTGDQTVAGTKTISGSLSLATALISTLVTGTAPLTIASTTKVPNLNADKVDGFDIAAYAGGGSYNFPGGLQVRFERGTSTIDGAETFTFDTPFTTECEAIVTVRKGENTTIPLTPDTVSKTGFTVNRNNAISGANYFYYIAIGY